MRRIDIPCIVTVSTLLLATVGVTPAAADETGRTQILPGQVIYNFDPNGNSCYPDNWTFFGYPQTDFGWDADAEDGGGAFQVADWTACELAGYPQCQWVGSAIGVGPFNHPQCVPGGVSDANLDLSLGTGLSLRIKDNITAGLGGTLGARVQLQLVDIDGTTAVTPRVILANPPVNRMPVLTDTWQTYVFYFNGLDWANDNDDAVAGNPPGLNLTHIKEIKLLWRRSTASGANSYEFDNITLLASAPVLWADDDSDGDVDLGDFAAFQRCVGSAPAGTCAAKDANGDGVIDGSDWQVFKDCMLGPGVTSGFYAWAY
jgi:hypothetical protein